MANNHNTLKFTGERLTTDIKNRIALEHIHRYALASELILNKVVLDAACGEGYGTNLLSQDAKKVIGIDISFEAIKHAKGKYIKSNLYFYQASVLSIPFKNNYFDVVVSYETIEHLEEHEDLISEFKRVLKSDGILIISSPDKLHYSINRKYINEFHKKELFNLEFKSLMKKHFYYCQFLNQKTVYNSIIVSEDKIQYFEELNGNFSEISKNTSLIDPLFNIAVCSDTNNPKSLVSIFNGNFIYDYIINDYEKKINSIQYLLKYLLRRLINIPLTITKKFFNKL